MIVALRRSEAKDPLPIARRIDQRSDMQLRVVGDINEVLRRELRQGPVLAGVGADDPVRGAVACLSEAGAVVGGG